MGSYFLVVSAADVVAVVSVVTFTESVATEVESVVAFSVEEPVPHEAKNKAEAKAKTVKVFIVL
jgi:hypothetical protein